MKITMLGTGNALVTECYNTCFMISDNEKLFLIDGGGGNTILHQLKHAGFDLLNVHDIFVTHKHTDHLLGVLWLIRIICQSMKKGEYKGDVNIYANDEVIELLRDLSFKLISAKVTKYIDDRLHFVELFDGEEKIIIDRKVTFFDIHSTKAKQFGFCMDIGNGDRITCCGDEPYNEKCYEYAVNSKWLLHEAFCLYSEADIFSPYEKHHSTVKDACELAEKLSVQNLLLYHTEDENIARRKELYTNEGKQHFSGNLFVPYDLETIEI